MLFLRGLGRYPLDTAFRNRQWKSRSEEWRPAAVIKMGTPGISAMSRTAVKSSTAWTRIRRAEAWLESRNPDEELLIIGASLDAANELARRVAKKKGAAFGWHRLTLPQLAFAIAAPVLAQRGLTPLSRIGADAVVARLVHRMNAEGKLSHYQSVQGTPGFSRAVAGVISELRLAHIPPKALADSAPYLAPLVEAYQMELKEAGADRLGRRARVRH
jgi:hypothetical protein